MITYFNWLLIGLLTFCTLQCTAQQFFALSWRRFALIVALIQLFVYEIVILIVDDFLVVILNYAPVLLLLLVCNLRGGRRTGSAAMTIEILVTFTASGIQAAGVDLFSPLDRNGLYHLGLMIAVVFFYRGGLRLQGFIR